MESFDCEVLCFSYSQENVKVYEMISVQPFGHLWSKP